MPSDQHKLRIAAAYGFLAVAFGAMGAHFLKKHWEETLPFDEVSKFVEIWKTASFYHIVHSVVLLVLAFAYPGRKEGRVPFLLIECGTVLFSGSLYALCLFKAAWLGPVTPVGGALLMAGWASLGICPLICGRNKA